MTKPLLLRIFSPFKKQSDPIFLMGCKLQDAFSTDTHLNDITSKALKHWKPKPVYDHTHTVAILVPLDLLFIGNRTQDYFKTLKDSPLQG